MIDVNELRKGVTFELYGEIYRVLEYQHHKPGRGKATIRTRVRNLRTGATIDRTFNSGDRVQDIRLDTRVAQYLYRDGDMFHFMDTTTYEQPVLGGALVGEAIPYLKEGQSVRLVEHEGEALDIELPVTVDLEVVEAEMAVKGDTATGATKSVKTETGLRVHVPLFVGVGDIIRVDTRSGEYLTRA